MSPERAVDVFVDSDFRKRQQCNLLSGNEYHHLPEAVSMDAIVIRSSIGPLETLLASAKRALWEIEKEVYGDPGVAAKPRSRRTAVFNVEALSKT